MRTSLIFLAAGTCLLISCAKKVTTKNEAPCEGVMCTMMFAMVTADVQDASGKPVMFDSFYTVRESNNEKLYHSNNGTLNNSYVILDDGDLKKVQNTTGNFYFVGYSKGAKVVNEPYTLSADCCHVSRQSGKSTIIVP